MECPEVTPTNLVIVSALKSLLKVLFVLVVAASIAGVVMLVKRPKDGQPISFDEWPDVPRNPDAD
jgi:hypothetical protein